MAAQKNLRATTQEFLEIADIQDDLLILKDGSCALLIQVSAVNFGLLSEEEQEAIIYAYAALLNSLSFPLQIFIFSKRMDISSYLEKIHQEEEKVTSVKVRAQMQKYAEFISQTVKQNRVLEKRFYLIIPFSAIELGVKGAFGTLVGKKTLPFPKNYIVQRAKTSLFPKRDHLLRQLARLGLRGEPLTTQKLVELFYEIYNPQTLGNVKVGEAAGYGQALVSSFSSLSQEGLNK